MKAYCVSALGFPALADNTKLIKNFQTSMAMRQDSAFLVSFIVVCKVA